MNFATSTGGIGVSQTAIRATQVSGAPDALQPKLQSAARRLYRAMRAWRARRVAGRDMVRLRETSPSGVALSWIRMRWTLSRCRLLRGSPEQIEPVLIALIALYRAVLNETRDSTSRHTGSSQTPTSSETPVVIQLLGRAEWNRGRLTDAVQALHEGGLNALSQHDVVVAQLKNRNRPTTLAAELRVLILNSLQRLLNPDAFADFWDHSTAASKAMRSIYISALVREVSARIFGLGKTATCRSSPLIAAIVAASERSRIVPSSMRPTALSRMLPYILALLHSLSDSAIQSKEFAREALRFLCSVDLELRFETGDGDAVNPSGTASRTLLKILAGGGGSTLLLLWVGAARCADLMTGAREEHVEGEIPPLHTRAFSTMLGNIFRLGTVLTPDALLQASGAASRVDESVASWSSGIVIDGQLQTDRAAHVWISTVSSLSKYLWLHEAAFVASLHKELSDGPLVSAVATLIRDPHLLSALFYQCGDSTICAAASSCPPSTTTLFGRIRRSSKTKTKGSRGSQYVRPALSHELIRDAYASPIWLSVVRLFAIVAGRGRHPVILNHFLTYGADQYRALWTELSSPLFASLLDFAFRNYRSGSCTHILAELSDTVEFVFMVFSHAFAVLTDDEWQASGLPFDAEHDSRAVVQLGSSFACRAVIVNQLCKSKSNNGGGFDGALTQIRVCLRMLVDRAMRVAIGVPGSAEGTATGSNSNWWCLDTQSMEDLCGCIEALAGETKGGIESLRAAVRLLDPSNAADLARRARAAVSAQDRAHIDEQTYEMATHPFMRSVAHGVPHVIPFSLRAEFMRSIFAKDRRARGVTTIKLGLKIRRSHLLVDAHDQIMGLQDLNLLRARFHIQFIDVHGQAEPGLDAGGVFKEFADQAIRKLISPDLGLFCCVEGRDETYPNPQAARVYGADWQLAFRFAGRIIGKVLYESVQVPIRLAPFAANAILGRGWSINDLKLLDAGLWNSLGQLKRLDDCSVAGLMFTDEETVLGETVETELVPGGLNIPVTNENLVRYIYLLARHRLFGRIAEATESIVAGMRDVMDLTPIRSFSAAEFQEALNGGDAGLDVADLSHHAKYVNYEPSDRTIRLLWEVLAEMDATDQGRFLAFCTGSSRPPLLGFQCINPPFTIAKTDTGTGDGKGSVLNYVIDIDRLPTASTCFNLLKLPPYRNKSNLKDKLLQAIRSDSGFGLS